MMYKKGLIYLEKSRVEESLSQLSLTSGMTRREFLIAPVITDLPHYTDGTLNVAYLVTISNQLKGSLDYLLQSGQTFLLIEAENKTLGRQADPVHSIYLAPLF